jgi:hypothetical protein
MAEYIDREAAEEAIYDAKEIDSINPITKYNNIYYALQTVPAADVVEVVRCGECIHNYGVKANCEFNPHDIVCDWWSTDGMDKTDFCSRGERRSE